VKGFYSISDHLIEFASKNSTNFYTLLELSKEIVDAELEQSFYESIDHFRKIKLNYSSGYWFDGGKKRYSFHNIQIDNLDKYLRSRINKKENDHFSQTLIISENKKFLLVQIDHIIADGISLLMFLNKQFDKVDINPNLELKTFPRKKNTPYKTWLPSQVLATHKGSSYAKRGYMYFCSEYKNNDQIIYAIFDSLKKMGLKRRSVWLPVNIRKKFFEGFGNAISRMRIYDNGVKVSKQKNECYKNGELMGVPNIKLNALNKVLIRLFLTRPLIDYGSILLSHIDEKKLGTNILEKFPKIISILNLHQKHTVAIFVSSSTNNHYTITYDLNRIDEKQINVFKDNLLEFLNQ
jgi:hypothetical protein